MYRQADYVDGSEGEPPLTWGYDDPAYDKAKVERRLGALIDFPSRQQKSWVDSGSGSRPKL